MVFSSRPTCHAYLRVDSGPDLLVGFADGSASLLNLKANLNSNSSKPIITSTVPAPSTSDQSGEKEQSKCVSVHWVLRQDQCFIMVVINNTCYVLKKPIAADPPSKESSKSTFSFSLRSHSSTGANEKMMMPMPFGLFAFSGDGVLDSQISPDGTKMAIACKDGTLRILDISDILCPVTIGGFKSYYGSFLCCAWSGNSRYVAAGSEDDLVTVFGIIERCPVAHCEGHQSWVSSVLFDNTSKSNGLCRLISVGQDAHVCFWDIEVGESMAGEVHSPSLQSTMRKTGSQMSLQQLGWQGQQEGLASLPGESPKGNSGDLKFKRLEGQFGSSAIVSSSKRMDMILYEPLVNKRIHPEPISSCIMAEEVFITSDCQGLVKVWTKV